MARKCEVCGRKSIGGASRSHSNIKSKRRLQINLQSKVVDGKRLKICTSCIKTKVKPVKIKKAKPTKRPG